MGWVNDRNVAAMGHAVAPFVEAARFTNPAVSPVRSATAPRAPVYLLHGDGDSVIPTAESVLLADVLRQRGVKVHLLVSHLITHAELNQNADAWDVWQLVAFWASVLRS
jgi:predicted esterase